MSRKQEAEDVQSSDPSEIPSSDTGEESDIEVFEEIPSEAITVAIFCALSYEAVAVKYSLDEEFACHPTAIGPHTYTYSFGRIRDHKIVIARTHQMGTASAAQCATTVRLQFPNIRFGLMVGVGVGIPRLPKRDIRLGDVAVSIPQEGHPGVIQYGFGKYELDGFVLKGPLNKPSSILVSTDGSLEEDEIMGRSPFKRILKSITKNPIFKRPTTSDILFHSHLNPADKADNSEGCKTSNEMKIVSRDTRHRRQSVVHRGLVLSGNGITEDPQDRDRLCKEHSDAVCFDTGAAGIMDVIPCLVVRGICDYVDTHKQDGWHHFAAASAASYCKAILCKVNAPHGEQICNIKGSVGKGMEMAQQNQRYVSRSYFPMVSIQS